MMSKLNNNIGVLNSQELNQVTGGWYNREHPHPEPPFRNPGMQLQYEMQGQFNAVNSALKGFTMPSIL
jgi:hypothetical protein